MIQTRALATLGMVLAGTVFWPAGSVPAERSPSVEANANHAAFDQQLFWRTTKVYCDSCHVGPKASAKLNLAALDLAHLDANGETWEKILRKLRNREMPPAGRAAAGCRHLRQASSHPSRPNATAWRRSSPIPAARRSIASTATEYANAIRDLLAVDDRRRRALPPDDAGYGFDNIGDVLSVSPVLMEGYLSAARKISRSAIGDRDADARRRQLRAAALPHPGRTDERGPAVRVRAAAWRCATIFRSTPNTCSHSPAAERLHLHRSARRDPRQIDVRIDGAEGQAIHRRRRLQRHAPGASRAPSARACTNAI